MRFWLALILSWCPPPHPPARAFRSLPVHWKRSIFIFRSSTDSVCQSVCCLVCCTKAVKIMARPTNSLLSPSYPPPSTPALCCFENQVVASIWWCFVTHGYNYTGVGTGVVKRQVVKLLIIGCLLRPGAGPPGLRLAGPASTKPPSAPPLGVTTPERCVTA